MVFNHDWFTPQKINFQKYLEKFKDIPDINFLEIGCFEGKATCWMLENILTGSNTKITVIDTFLGSSEHKEWGIDVTGMEDIFRDNISRWKDKVEICIGDSQDILEMLVYNHKEFYNFIYIDGSHFPEDVFRDAVGSWTLLRKGGLMAFDDYLWISPSGKLTESPKPGIDKFLNLYVGQYSYIVKDYQVWIEKDKIEKDKVQ